MENNGKENLISINEIIARAKSLGVNFGNGEAHNRLRYYTKFGLLPHAVRKSFNGDQPSGAYPEYVVDLLVDIDKQIKEGKSIQNIIRENSKKELQEEKKEEKEPVVVEEYFRSEKDLSPYEYFQSEPEKEDVSFLSSRSTKVKKNYFFIKIGLPLLFFAALVFLLSGQVRSGKTFSYFLAAMDSIRNQLVAVEESVPASGVAGENFFVTSFTEPFLTINAETLIKEKITSPIFSLKEGDYSGDISAASLSADQSYNFPDQSGTICLSTGNCVGLGGEIFTSGAIPNRVVKFTSSQRVGNSSINDLYSGLSVTIDNQGDVGIGITNPIYPLHVEGRIQATGDICTDLEGGKCLSDVAETQVVYIGGGGGGTTVISGVDGSGSTNYLPRWTGATTLGNSILSQSGSNLNLAGNLLPTATTTYSLGSDTYKWANLYASTGTFDAFVMSTNASSGYVLTSDGSGVGTWQFLPSGNLPSGTSGQTLRNNGINWVADSFLYNSGSFIGIGATSSLSTLTVAGSGYFQGPLTVATSTLPQLVLSSNNNFLNFSLQGSEARISASSTLVIDSLTGEVRLGASTTLFNASGTEIRGNTFVSASDDSTVRKSGEKVFRNSIPIFRFSIPSQTNSTTFVRVSKQFNATNTLDSVLPTVLPGATRTYAFLINFADNVPQSASSSWRVWQPGSSTEFCSFSFSGQELSSLSEGEAHLSSFYQLPNDDWQLELSIPSNDIRIFNIFLLAYDQIL